jgi:hypothetical protein
VNGVGRHNCTLFCAVLDLVCDSVLSRLKEKLSCREEVCASVCFCSGDVDCLGGPTLIEKADRESQAGQEWRRCDPDDVESANSMWLCKSGTQQFTVAC